jgi:signal transduction histidine kinase/CheY-like chemotaxis protein
VLSLFAAVAIAPLVSATIGVAFLIAGGLYPASAAPSLWPVWWLGDALGGLIVAPLILVWSQGDRLWRTRGLVEPTAMLAGVILASGFVFFLPPSFPAAYFVYPFLIWAALRLGPAFTTTASLLANAIAILGTLSGRGPFAGAGPEGGLVLVQVYMAVGAATALILGAVAAQSRRTHERAELSEERLRMAMAGARVGVWDWNILTGEPYDAFRETIHPDDRERVEPLIARAIETRAPFEAQFRLLGSDGVVRWTSARGIVLDDAQGRAARMIGVTIDFTQQKQYEDELRLQHQRKDEFLAMLGHELRNPLAAIVHAVDLLSSDEAQERVEAQRVIRRQTRSLSRLIDDLLDVSRITRGQIKLDRRTLPLGDVVNAGVDVWRHLVAQKQQRLTIDVPKEPLWVSGDLTRLTQIVANLVHNAAKFTPDRGTIVVSAAEENGAAVLRVRDDGQGMSAEVREHAFELFVQGLPTLDRQLGGLGLGLTLVRRLTQMHGGSVEAKSDGDGRGTEITVRLPLVERPEPEVASESDEPVAAAAQRRRVLVVEDNADAQAMLVYLLKHRGYEVRAVGDGEAAIAEADAFAPEVVLLDVGLPGLDGYEVARALRASPRTASALLVALTGYGQAEDRERAFAAGFDHHLLKPTDPAQVLEVMRAPSRSA